MRNRGRIPLVLLLSIVPFALNNADVHAQVQTHDRPAPRAELALAYNYVHSNTLPAGCGCFNLNGGSGTFAWQVVPAKFGLVGDISVTRGTVGANSYDLTLSTFTFGGRYMPEFKKSPVRPFGQVLLGFAHSNGSLVATGTPATNAGSAFALNMGGGFDLRANRRFSFRVIEADYLLTTFNNSSNNHQNNLRISTGIVFHLGH